MYTLKKKRDQILFFSFLISLNFLNPQKVSHQNIFILKTKREDSNQAEPENLPLKESEEKDLIADKNKIQFNTSIFKLIVTVLGIPIAILALLTAFILFKEINVLRVHLFEGRKHEKTKR